MSKRYREFIDRSDNKRLNFTFWGLLDSPKPKMRLYRYVRDEETLSDEFFREEGAYLTKECYSLEEFNREIDLFQKDLENIKKEAKRKFDLFIKMKGEDNEIND